jgi:hypothetical protein
MDRHLTLGIFNWIDEAERRERAALRSWGIQICWKNFHNMLFIVSFAAVGSPGQGHAMQNWIITWRSAPNEMIIWRRVPGLWLIETSSF